jgi:hypothetical protein
MEMARQMFLDAEEQRFALALRAVSLFVADRFG